MAGEIPNDPYLHYRSLPRNWRYTHPKRIPQLGRLPTQPSWGLLPGPRGDPVRPFSNQPVGPEFPKGNGRPAAGSQSLGRRTCPNTPCVVSVPARMAARSWATKARSWRCDLAARSENVDGDRILGDELAVVRVAGHAGAGHARALRSGQRRSRCAVRHSRVRLTVPMIEGIDAWARRNGVSRSQAIRRQRCGRRRDLLPLLGGRTDLAEHLGAARRGI